VKIGDRVRHRFFPERGVGRISEGPEADEFIDDGPEWKVTWDDWIRPGSAYTWNLALAYTWNLESEIYLDPLQVVLDCIE